MDPMHLGFLVFSQKVGHHCNQILRPYQQSAAQFINSFLR